MELAKKFENLTWADLTIVDDELKAVTGIRPKAIKVQGFADSLQSAEDQGG